MASPMPELAPLVPRRRCPPGRGRSAPPPLPFEFVFIDADLVAGDAVDALVDRIHRAIAGGGLAHQILAYLERTEAVASTELPLWQRRGTQLEVLGPSWIWLKRRGPPGQVGTPGPLSARVRTWREIVEVVGLLGGPWTPSGA